MLHLAAKGNNASVVKMLLGNNLDPNAVNHAEQTVVYVAADYGATPALMELLLNAGGDVNRPDKVSGTFLRERAQELMLIINYTARMDTINCCNLSKHFTRANSFVAQSRSG